MQEQIMTRSLTDNNCERIERDRKSYDDMSLNQSNLLDKSIIYLSGGVFGVATGFVNTIIPLKTSCCSKLFWIALLLFLFSIITSLLSFVESEKYCRFLRNLCDKAEQENNYSIMFEEYENKDCLNFYNNCRLWSFILGLSLLGIFIFINGLIN